MAFTEIPFYVIDWSLAFDGTEISDSLAFSVDIGSAQNVTNATNATPIVISVAGTWAVGDSVYVSGVTGNTAANGFWRVSAIGAGTITLLNSEGNGAWVSGGTVQQRLKADPRSTVLGMGRIAQLVMAWNPCSGTGATPGAGARRVIY